MSSAKYASTYCHPDDIGLVASEIQASIEILSPEKVDVAIDSSLGELASSGRGGEGTVPRSADEVLPGGPAYS